MLDTIYRTLQTIINKEQNGYVSPDEFNLIANNVQLEIYREYFDDENKNKDRENRGRTNGGYSNLAANDRQRIQQFAADSALVFDTPTQSFTLPTDLYLIEDDGVTTAQGRIIEETQRKDIGYAALSIAAPSEIYPVYERYNKYIRVYPATINSGVSCKYLRKPLPPKWTYVVVSNNPMFNEAASDYQDFELHESEFTNIVMRMLSLFGINLREQEVIQVAETMKDKNNFKESN